MVTRIGIPIEFNSVPINGCRCIHCISLMDCRVFDRKLIINRRNAAPVNCFRQIKRHSVQIDRIICKIVCNPHLQSSGSTLFLELIIYLDRIPGLSIMIIFNSSIRGCDDNSSVLDKVFKFIRIFAVIASESSWGILGNYLLRGLFLSIFCFRLRSLLSCFILSSLLFRLALVGVLVIIAVFILSLIDFGCCRLRLGLCLLNRYMNGRHITIRKTAVVERSRKGIRSGSTSVIVSMPGNRFVYCLLRNRRCCLLGSAFSRCDRL